MLLVTLVLSLLYASSIEKRPKSFKMKDLKDTLGLMKAVYMDNLDSFRSMA